MSRHSVAVAVVAVATRAGTGFVAVDFEAGVPVGTAGGGGHLQQSCAGVDAETGANLFDMAVMGIRPERFVVIVVVVVAVVGDG